MGQPTVSSDPLREIVRYYIKQVECSLQDDADTLTRDVCFLVVISGANMTIYGGIHGRYITVDRLVPTVWLVLQPKDMVAMIITSVRTKIAVKIKALFRSSLTEAHSAASFSGTASI